MFAPIEGQPLLHLGPQAQHVPVEAPPHRDGAVGEAVSYTHLDVYKRQAEGEGKSKKRLKRKRKEKEANA